MRVGDVLAANDVEPEDAVGTKTSEMPRKRCLIQSHSMVSKEAAKLRINLLSCTLRKNFANFAS